MLRRKGFTLIELIMVIVILGILAAVAIPTFYDLQVEAKNAAEKGTIGGVRAGIQTYFAKYRTFPSALGGSGTCSKAAPCFTSVLTSGGVTDSSWSVSGSVYTGPANGTYTYTSASGSFQ